jgi:hypothetical protein
MSSRNSTQFKLAGKRGSVSRRRHVTLSAATALIAANAAYAVSTTYVGPNFGSFSVASHWSTGVAPHSGDDVYVGYGEGSISAMTVLFNYGKASYTSGGFDGFTVDSPDITQNITLSESPALGFTFSLQAGGLVVGDENNGTFIQGGVGISNNSIT